MERISHSDKPHVEFDTQHCTLSPAAATRMVEAIEPLRRIIDCFPKSDLHVTLVHHARSRDYHVKTSLVLPGKTLFTGERRAEALPAYLACVHKLIRKVEAYKGELSNAPGKRKHAKGTHQEVLPDQLCDLGEIERAVAARDYGAFRQATVMFDEPVRKRAGRWIQRYPQAQAQIDAALALENVVEEVFLNAFEQFPEMPGARRFGEWLEELIDPSVRALLSRPDEELQNVEFARMAREAGAEPES